jgi:hypothetical protein
MDAIIIWLNLHPWAIEAACDVITFACCTGVVWLIAGRRQAPIHATPRMVRGPEIKTVETSRDLESTKSQTRVISNEPFVSPAKRRLVNDALAAMGRWEATYRPGRGLDDLAKLSRSTGHAHNKTAAETR